MKRSNTGTAINIGLSVGTLIVFTLIIEFGLRITGLQSAAPNPPKIYQTSDNPDISYELIPNVHREKAYKARVSTNENGFRSPALDERPIIAILGDSIAFGHGVDDDETLSAHLGDLVPEYQFLNAAVPGYQLQQESATYEQKVASLNPNAAILVFYWNDLQGNPPGILDNNGILRPHDWVENDETCNPITEGLLGKIPGKCWLDVHSAFYKAVKKVMNLKASKSTQEQQREEKAKEEPFTDAQLAVYIRDLRNAANLLPRNRTFVIWPDNYEHIVFRQKLAAAAAQYGFTVIDLYDLFGNTVETLPWDTVHPSPDALRKAANYIARFLMH